MPDVPTPTQHEQLMEALAKECLSEEHSGQKPLKVTILTGAGVSTDSGLPDFRGSLGLWEDAEWLELLTARGAIERFDAFTAFCKKAIAEVARHQPNIAHQMIAELQKAGVVGTIITQNVDGYHQEAGATGVIEVHGSLRDIRCSDCDMSVPVAAYMAEGGEHCACGGHRRPAMTLFDEPLPTAALEASLKALSGTRLLIVAGSSLAVSPTSLAPEIVVAHGGQVAIFNREPTRLDALASYVFHQPLSETMRLLYRFALK